MRTLRAILSLTITPQALFSQPLPPSVADNSCGCGCECFKSVLVRLASLSAGTVLTASLFISNLPWCSLKGHRSKTKWLLHSFDGETTTTSVCVCVCVNNVWLTYRPSRKELIEMAFCLQPVWGAISERAASFIMNRLAALNIFLSSSFLYTHT